jgi:CheY-like chemotaxis protein
VLVDPAQVEQVLLNLCINARDATAGLGQVRVTVQAAHAAGLVCASCRRPVDGDYVELRVDDDGHGIDAAVLDRIFEPFFTTKETGKGSGMGLAMVHGIVHEHKGHIVVASNAGRGASFRVLWPESIVDTALVSVDGGPARTSARLSRPRLEGSVLIVDDQESVGGFMRELLESWGLSTTVASQGDIGLELVRSTPSRFDVVITDQSMPRMTGIELARQLHEIRPDLPVILCTGYGEGLTTGAPASMGLHAIVHKPIDPTLLCQALASCRRQIEIN